MEKDKVSRISFSKLLGDFLRGSTAHGLPKVVTSASRTRQVIWLIVFCTAFAYFIYQCTILVNYYLSYPVSVQIDVTTLKSMNFPAVTVCNMNMLKKDIAITDKKYKEMVFVDQYFEDHFKSINDSQPNRKRRDVSNGSLLRRKLAVYQFLKTNVNKMAEDEYVSINSNGPNSKKEEIRATAYRKTLTTNKLADPRSDQLLGLSREKRELDESSSTPDADYDWDSWFGDGSGEPYDPSYSNDDYGEYEDYGFAGNIADDYAFKEFVKHSRTSDYSDLIDVLKPSREDLDAYGHQASDFILQCSFNKMNCSYV
ncbi:hypothetical protein LSH36_199g03027 [Paralvinella palmiformis]|uniref:Uncharacterized protein n=1 Tax=Paralvinella palmiformis TaxID=53620 RepID=A0AAD9JQJ9_9ANNE|nr:hypothetical protein LSH36_199g03027 [Paralvinella palmiformis]